MKELHFMQELPEEVFTNEDKTDYSERNKGFIQSLKTMENLMDINAFIIDCQNSQIFYATQECLSFFAPDATKKNKHLEFDFLDNYMCPEEIHRVAKINSTIIEFFYSLPKKRRQHLYSTHDFRVRIGKYTTLMNLKISILDLTEGGEIRLSLCVLTHSPIHTKPCNTYIKMLDTGTVYELMSSSPKFVEVKTQRLTSKATRVLELSSSGKSEAEIAEILGISISTVKYHKQKIFFQLGVKNTTEAIQWMNNQKKMTKRK